MTVEERLERVIELQGEVIEALKELYQQDGLLARHVLAAVTDGAHSEIPSPRLAAFLDRLEDDVTEL